MERPFEGFPKGGFAFLKEVDRRQDRVWFAQHKDEYQTLWHQPMQALLDALAKDLGKAFPSVKEAPAKVFRIYNDTRFHKDKPPLKTHVAGMLPIGVPPGQGSGLYVHFGLDETIVAAGRWMMEPDELSRFRDAVAQDKSGKPFARELAALTRKGFELHSHGMLKRVPAPFPADHPRADLLRRKGLSFGFPTLPRSLVGKPALVPWIVRHARSAAKVLYALDRMVWDA